MNSVTPVNSLASEDSIAVVDTRLVHEVHRVGTSLLADAAADPAVPAAALAQLRDFLVANVRHHHETEDEELWPLVAAAAPDAAAALDALSEEHRRLDKALDALAAVALGDGSAGDEGAGDADAGDARLALREAAVEVRDAVHGHLAAEEPVLLPALRERITDAQWKDFSQRVIATTPPVAGHLMIGFLDEVGTPAEVETVLAGLPEPVRPLLDGMRKQAADDLRTLRGTRP
jgi:iron-sulfur cluster repair protein YtfE (RIC family)